MKQIFKKIFFLPPVLTLLIAIPSYGLVIYALRDENANPAITYVAYLMSAYAFIITVTGISGVIYWIQIGVEQHPVIRRLLGIPLLNRYWKDDVFRAKAALYQGIAINFLYAGFKLFSGIHYKSLWFATLAIYYLLLAVMRFSLLYHVRREEGNGKNKISEWRSYRMCGIILLFMNQALVGIIILVIRQNSSFEYPGVLIYIMAIYAFYATITAVRKMVKFRKYQNPVLAAAKIINLTAALVSMLSLETAMLTQFGAADDASFRKGMTASTGAGISMIVLGMAVYMITQATKQLRKQNIKSSKEGIGYDSYTGTGG